MSLQVWFSYGLLVCCHFERGHLQCASLTAPDRFYHQQLPQHNKAGLCIAHVQYLICTHTYSLQLYTNTVVVFLFDAHKHHTLLGAHKAARNGSLWVFLLQCQWCSGLLLCKVKETRTNWEEVGMYVCSTKYVWQEPVFQSKHSISFIALMHSARYISMVFPTSVARSLKLSWVVG